MNAYEDYLDEPGAIDLDSDAKGGSVVASQNAPLSCAEISRLEDEYFEQLPRVALASCPFCATPLSRTVDPFGLDGLWWRSHANPQEPQACPHFCVLLGAVDLGDHQPRPAFDVHPGPGAPFVMPKLLAHPGMTAVVAEIPMVDGAIAYPVAYFAPRRPPVQTLTASWARTNFVYTTQLGEHAWRAADQPSGAPDDRTWDFELQPWLAAGRLRWCEPGTDRTRLSRAAPEACPFLGRSGARTAQRILAVP
jgi:hypothetical protein